MKLGSLFDGIGGFPLAGTRHGITPVWASEIEPLPIKVTTVRFPDMEHLGDITKIDGGAIEPVDIITFGSPCQDLSVAGKRAGMQHESKGDEITTRSGLFMEAVRIIKEMRNATGLRYTNDGSSELDGGETTNIESGKSRDGVCGNSGGTNGITRDGATGHVRPRWAVWENVPGAYSSNKGEDFRVVLEELCRIVEPSASIPQPAKGKWLNDGAIVGDGWSIAWRTLDAQHWGVPQRRRRIYLVCDFAGGCAPEILFEREGLRRDIAESGEAWEDRAADATGRADGAEECLTPWDVQSRRIHPVSGTRPALYAGEGGGHGYAAIPINDQATHVNGGCNGSMVGNPGDPMYSLTVTDKHAVAFGVGESPDVAHCLRAGASKADKHESTTYVCSALYENHGQDSRLTGPLDISPTVAAKFGTGGNNTPLVEHYLKSRRAQSADDAETWVPDAVANTVNCFDVGDVRATDIVMAHGQANAEIGTFSLQRSDEYKESEVACTQARRQYKDATDLIAKQMRVRRLTPLECERLQGFPDGWTDIPGGSDSARYKALGNSLAIPTAEFVIEGIAEAWR